MSLFTSRIFTLLLFILFFTQSLLSQVNSIDSNSARVDHSDSTTSSIKGDMSLTQNKVLTSQLTLRKFTQLDSPNAVLKYKLPFSTLFKYDTSPGNPDHRCYEITKPLTEKYTLLFNFMSQRKYTIGDQ